MVKLMGGKILFYIKFTPQLQRKHLNNKDKKSEVGNREKKLEEQ
jgi:hypothetical protein